MASVVNIKDTGLQPGIVRIDRKTKWGNPFVIGKDGSREEVVLRYKQYFLASSLMNDLEELRGKDLACWCAPLTCHGDVLVILANG